MSVGITERGDPALDFRWEKMIKCKKYKNPLPETAHYCPNRGLERNLDPKRHRGQK